MNGKVFMLSEIWFMRGRLPGVCPVVRHGLMVGTCGTRLLTQYGSREDVRVLRSRMETCPERVKGLLDLTSLWICHSIVSNPAMGLSLQRVNLSGMFKTQTRADLG